MYVTDINSSPIKRKRILKRYTQTDREKRYVCELSKTAVVVMVMMLTMARYRTMMTAGVMMMRSRAHGFRSHGCSDMIILLHLWTMIHEIRHEPDVRHGKSKRVDAGQAFLVRKRRYPFPQSIKSRIEVVHATSFSYVRCPPLSDGGNATSWPPL